MKTIKVCSKCGSVNLKMATRPWLASHGITTGQYACMDCGFEGIAIEIDEKNLEKFRKELKDFQ
ncbi:MAG: hypothetical protein JW772_04130 [Candidatus Diapherotrites archaeon]|nr:hypothetical protein [Candidatus Diapherotrites archaeon]